MERIIDDYSDDPQDATPATPEIVAAAPKQTILLYRGVATAPEVYIPEFHIASKAEMWNWLDQKGIHLDDACSAMVEPALQKWVERYNYFIHRNEPAQHKNNFNVSLGPDEQKDEDDDG